ncbi:MAG: hypothetical protein V3V62_10405 [bacterium]
MTGRFQLDALLPREGGPAMARLFAPLLLAASLLGPAPARAADRVEDMAWKLAQQLEIQAPDPAAALFSLQFRGILPARLDPGAHLTPKVARDVLAGLILWGRSPGSSAKAIAHAVAAASQDSVRGIVGGLVAAARQMDFDVEAVAFTASWGAVEGALSVKTESRGGEKAKKGGKAEPRASAVARAAAEGAGLGALASCADLLAVVRAASRGAVRGAKAAGASVDLAAQGVSLGAIEGAMAAEPEGDAPGREIPA